MSDPIEQETGKRYCPNCGATTNAEFCPADGVATVQREALTVDASQLHTGDVIEGRYRITGVLGRGGFGAVYSAEHTGTQQQVALKMMLPNPEGTDEDEIRRFYREAQVTASLRHANTVRVFDVGQTAKGALYIAMEMLRGPTLAAHLKARIAAGGPLSEHEAIDIALPVLRSLHEAHKKSLVHRDLKPANIMLTRLDEDDEDDDVVVKVLDFGIARPQESSLTGAGTSLGTPAYMSPEQCQGKTLDGRSDLYSLGVILFLCTAGKVPFEDRNPLTVMFKHAAEPVPDLQEMAPATLSEDFVACVHRALAKGAHERFPSARAMRQALEAVRAGRPLPADDTRQPSSSGIPAMEPEPRGRPTEAFGGSAAVGGAPQAQAAVTPDVQAALGGSTLPYVESTSKRIARIDVTADISVDDETTAQPLTPGPVPTLSVADGGADAVEDPTVAAPVHLGDAGESPTVAATVTTPASTTSIPATAAAPAAAPAPPKTAAPATQADAQSGPAEPPARRRQPIAIWVGMGAVVILAAVGGFALRGSGNEQPAGDADKGQVAAPNAALAAPTTPAPTAAKGAAAAQKGADASATKPDAGAAAAHEAGADAHVAGGGSKESADAQAEKAPTPVAGKPAVRPKRAKKASARKPATAKPRPRAKPRAKAKPKPAKDKGEPVQRFFLD